MPKSNFTLLLCGRLRPHNDCLAHMRKKQYSLFCILFSFDISSYAHGQEALAWGFGWLTGILLTLIMIFTAIKGWKNRLCVFLISTVSGFATGTFPGNFYRNYLNDGGLEFMLAFGTTTLVLMVSTLFIRLRKKGPTHHSSGTPIGAP